MSLDFPLLVRSRNFCFFFCLGGGKGTVFLLCFCPLSREGNSGLHSTRSNYSSFYGIRHNWERHNSKIHYSIAQIRNLILPLGVTFGVYAQASTTPACPNTSPLPLVIATRHCISASSARELGVYWGPPRSGFLWRRLISQVPCRLCWRLSGGGGKNDSRTHNRPCGSVGRTPCRGGSHIGGRTMRG